MLNKRFIASENSLQAYQCVCTCRCYCIPELMQETSWYIEGNDESNYITDLPIAIQAQVSPQQCGYKI